ncbi:MAG: helix-turn-helix transcriptional regulator [Candidatus Lambdaproteobacteria bacterium]|nr:helix-turn-helix transcriptional regulator [Candidatus Lambdaproteobacteria bacterium]
MSSALKREPAGEDRLDAVFHALAHRTRRALLARLRQGPAKVTDLAEPFDMSLPTVSKHIKVLERAALVRRAVDGRIHRCTLAAEPLADVEQWLEHYREFWRGTLEALARYAEAQGGEATPPGPEEPT